MSHALLLRLALALLAEVARGGWKSSTDGGRSRDGYLGNMTLSRSGGARETVAVALALGLRIPAARTGGRDTKSAMSSSAMSMSRT